METTNTKNNNLEEVQMRERVFRSFRDALKYSAVTTVLNKFCNVELMLLNWYGMEESSVSVEHPEGLRKYIDMLEKEIFGKTGIKVEDGALENEEIVNFIKSFSFDGTPEQTILTYHGKERACDIYLRQPRANSLDLHMNLVPETSLTLQNYYNIYPSEGFIISFALEDRARVSFCPESKDGKKGAGDVYVYVYTGEKIVRVPLSSYVPSAEVVLKMFRG